MCKKCVFTGFMQFGILGWIRSGDGIHNAYFLSFRDFPILLAFRSEVVICLK